MALPITITDAGRAEIINAQNTGTGPVTITEIGFGTGQYTPTKTLTALQAQVKRVSSIAGQAVAADTIHVMAMDESSAAYNVGEFGLFSEKGTLIAVFSQPAASGWIIQKAGASTLLLATDIILESLNATSITFGDISFINPPATTTVQGVVELATPEETQIGTDGTRAVTPVGLKSLTASTTRAGLVQLNDTLTSSSATQALTAAQGKKLQDEKQPKDDTLTALAALITAANKLIYATGADSFATTDLTAFARTLLDDADATAARVTLGAAPLASPAFTGTPTAPTAAAGNNSTLLANTAFVQAAIAALVNSSPGTLDTLNELAAALGNDPNFATTMATALAGKQPLDATLTALAGQTVAANKLIYATGADAFATTDLTAFARTLLDDADATAARATLGAAPLASPAFTGTPTAPTAAAGNNSTLLANTAFVQAAIAALVNSSPGTLDTLNELAAALGNDPNFATTMATALAGKQPLDATLTALAGQTVAANKLIYATGADAFATTDLTAFARSLLDDADAATARATLGANNASNLNAGTVGISLLPTAVRNLAQGATTQDPNAATDPVILTNHGNSPGQGLYWHIFTTFYSTISSTANRSQIAISYNGASTQQWARHCFSGIWSTWVRCDLGGVSVPANTGSLGATGWWQDGDTGLITQWGLTASVAGNSYTDVTFPMTFPAECFGVQATLLGAGTNIPDKDALAGIPSTTGVRLYNNGSNSSNRIYWEAKGR
ncbi:gp53-like domain-containing protein [Stutzerimonas balearica]|uniref:gp53-like domain-containing protein n=1 Tax=Stutzerimonas balearica TaxID=74829 RepID=UPI001BC9143E|nr:phage tail protein [Stutzerimonas balearica]